MKKLLIATAALAMVAGTAQAQSSVTVYGVLDQGVQSKTVTNGNNVAGGDAKVSGFTTGQLSSQRLGFRGTEDLGGGLKANFQYELGFVTGGVQIDTGATKARVSTVGVESASFGRFDFGFNKTANQLMLESFTAGGANNFIGEAFLNTDETTTGNINVTTHRPMNDFIGARHSGIHYATPVMSGFQLAATIAEDNTKDNDASLSGRDKNSVQDLTVAYTGIKNLRVGFGTSTKKVDSAATAMTDIKTQFDQIGASYTMGSATVYVHSISAKETGADGAEDTKVKGEQYGVKYAVSPKVTVHALYGDTTESEVGVKVYDRKSYQLGALYALSKRTTAYAMLGESKATKANDADVNKLKGFTAGVRHSF
jgi:predicted porin